MNTRRRNKNLKQYRQVRVRANKKSGKISGRHVGWAIAVCCFISVLSVGYKSLASSAVFHAANISVNGCNRLDTKSILKLGNIDIHTNVLAVNPQMIQKKIEEHDWVESVAIVRELPGTFAITVTEREPVAMVNMKKGLYYIDQNGVAFAKVGSSDDHDFPVMTGFEKENLPKEIIESALHEALLFLKYASHGDALLPKQNVSEVHVTDQGNIIAFLVDRPFPIFLGKGNISTKYCRLATVLHKLYKKELFAETTYIRMDYGVNKVLVGKAEST